jgi:hypothetical protein
MQTEKGMEKGQLLEQTQEKVLSTTIKEITPFGVKLEINAEGPITGVLYVGKHTETGSLYLKNDGTVELEAKAIDTTKEGDILVISFKGEGRINGNGTGSAEGKSFITTQSTRLAQLNNSFIRVEATVDFGTGDAGLKYYKL